MMLDVENLSVCYPGKEALRDLSFSVHPGEWLMIVGPNGCGKTTALNAIARNVPSSGRVLFEGKDISRFRAKELARSIGLLSQNHFVGYDFTVEEVIRLGRYAYTSSFSEKSDKEAFRIDEAVKKTGLEGSLKQSVLTLSGGELQRTFLAQLFAQNPRLLMLDEPTNHLDLIYQKQIFSLIREWIGEGNRAVISVVHDLSLAMAFGTHALLMDGGKAVCIGKTREVLTPENLNSVYSMDVFEWMRNMYSQWQV